MAIDDPVLDNLSDRAELRSLVQRYSRAVDTRDFEALDQLFDPDGEVHGALGVLPVGQYLGQMRSRPRTFAASMHFLGDPLIELAIGTDIGRLDTYGVVFQRRGEDTEGNHVQLGIRYIDDVVKRDGRWMFHKRRATIVWTQEIPRTLGPP